MALGMLLGVLLGWLASATWHGRDGRGRQAEEARDRERLESERALARLRRELDDVVIRSRAQSELFQMLPNLLGQMFSVQGRREVGPTALKLVDELLRPEQCALFVTRSSQRCVALAAGLRLPAHVPQGFEVEYGKGRIGHVAEKGVAMDEADFRALPLSLKRDLDGTFVHGLRADVVVPVEQEGGLVGVLCAGGIRARHGQEKRILMMVGDVTAVALAHASRLKAADDGAHIDGLTGLWNRRRLEERLEEEVQKAERERRNLSVLILDIDHFKAYNDSNGHLKGDDLLRQLGQLLKASIREDDLAARYEGAELVVLYPGAAKTLATRLANSLRHTVAAYPFPHRQEQPSGAVTVSGGVATFPEDSGSGADLLRCADQALYEAKAAGGNRVVAAVALDPV
jgi:diguanylate cyclase (GGDEF)-like protein